MNGQPAFARPVEPILKEEKGEAGHMLVVLIESAVASFVDGKQFQFQIRTEAVGQTSRGIAYTKSRLESMKLFNFLRCHISPLPHFPI